MINQPTPIRIDLPPDIKKSAVTKARKSGMLLEGYIRELVIKDVTESEYPVFEASERTIKAYKEAMKNRDKAVVVTNIKEFFKNL